MLDSFAVGNTTFSSRLLVGTGKYASYNLMHDALVASQSDIVTVALRRVGTTQSGGYIKLYPWYNAFITEYIGC